MYICSALHFSHNFTIRAKLEFDILQPQSSQVCDGDGYLPEGLSQSGIYILRSSSIALRVGIAINININVVLGLFDRRAAEAVDSSDIKATPTLCDFVASVLVRFHGLKITQRSDLSKHYFHLF